MALADKLRLEKQMVLPRYRHTMGRLDRQKNTKISVYTLSIFDSY